MSKPDQEDVNSSMCMCSITEGSGNFCSNVWEELSMLWLLLKQLVDGA